MRMARAANYSTSRALLRPLQPRLRVLVNTFVVFAVALVLVFFLRMFRGYRS